MKKLLTRLLQPVLTPTMPAVRAVSERRDDPVHEMMASTQRELALFAADMMGAQSYMRQFGLPPGRQLLDTVDQRLFRDLIEGSELPFLVIDPRPGLRIVEANDAYCAATMTARRGIAGEKLFDAFPENPDTRDADGVSNLYVSLQKAAQSGEPHAMAVQRYDVRDAAGLFVERHWQPLNTPILDETGRLAFLLHHVREVRADESCALPLRAAA